MSQQDVASQRKLAALELFKSCNVKFPTLKTLDLKISVGFNFGNFFVRNPLKFVECNVSATIQ